MLCNLKAEMSRHGLTAADIGRCIEKTEKTAQAKIRGEYPFTYPELVKIRDVLFPNCELDYLGFDDKEVSA